MLVTVTGLEMPINLKIGTFWYVIDNDDNSTSVMSSGQFLDMIATGSSASSNVSIPAMQVLAMNLSSYLLRDSNVTLSLDFYLPGSINAVTSGQYLMVSFPANYEDILRFVTPVCKLNIRNSSSTNYVGACLVYGMRIKMPILNTLTLATVYRLTIKNLLNPFNPTSHTYKYTL